MTVKRTLDKLWYPEYQDEWDGRCFRDRILRYITPSTHMLDIGAGRGATSHMQFKGLVAEVIGTDIDEAVTGNSHVDRAIHTPDGTLRGVEDGSCDVAVSKHVLEHVSDPVAFFREISRVLKPGGIFLALTPNGSHYVPIIARITPLWFHRFFNKLRGRETVDTFPTLYRANSQRALKRWAAASGLELISVEFQEGRPEYLRMSPITYFLGMIYERVVNGLALNALKCVIYVTMRKPGANTSS